MTRWALLFVLAAAPAGAATVLVGAEGPHRTLAAGVAAARDGDTIRLAAGEYFECAVLGQADLVVEGAGAGTVLSDRTCEGKGILIARGDRLTVRDLVLARARVADGNGAGIRLEAQGLTVERVRFENDQVGILAGTAGPGAVRVIECGFEGGGVVGERPTSAIMVGAVSLLQVDRSVFTNVKGGQIATGAVRTELVGNRIGSGVEAGASPAVQAGGGALVMRENLLSLGPESARQYAAVVAMAGPVALHANRLENTTGRAQSLLLNWSGETPVLEGNTVGPADTLVSSSGVWRHRAGRMARDVMGGVRGLAGSAKRGVMGVLGR